MKLKRIICTLAMMAALSITTVGQTKLFADQTIAMRTYMYKDGHVQAFRPEFPAETFDSEYQAWYDSMIAEGYIFISPDIVTIAINSGEVTQGVDSNLEEVLIKYAKMSGAIPGGAEATPQPESAPEQAVQESAPEQTEKQESEPETEAQAETEPAQEAAKTYEHGVYDELDREALDAFDYFLHDGQEGSCYIQVKNSAQNKIMPGYRIKRTHELKENGEIQFVDDEGNVVYSVIFPQVECENDQDIDLGIETSLSADGIMTVEPARQKLSYTPLGFSYDIKLKEGSSEVLLYTYTKSDKAGEGYVKHSRPATDSDGFFKLTIGELREYYVSEKDLLAKEETLETEVKEETAPAEIQDNVEENTEEVKTDVNEVQTDTNEARENITAENTEVKQASNWWVYCLAGAAAVVVVLGIILFRRKR